MTTIVPIPSAATAVTKIDIDRAARLLVEIALNRPRPYLTVADMSEQALDGVVLGIHSLEMAARSTRVGL